MAKTPIFAVGNWEKIQAALENGTLTYPSYIWVIDESAENGEKNDHFVFIDSESNIREVVGNNPKSVKKVDALPKVAEAEADVLYIYNGIVYVLNSDGTEFTPMYQDVTDQLSEITARLDTAETNITAVDEKVTDIDERVTALEESEATSTTILWIDLTETSDEDQNESPE